MSMGTLTMVADAVGGKLIGGDRNFESVSTDTRTLQPQALFFALRGERFDAADFVTAAAAAGAAGAVVEQRQDSDLAQVEVSDTRLALGALAKFWRAQFGIPVIAVTGSNGKTTVKEMIAGIVTAHAHSQVPGDQKPVLVTLGNLNNDIGLPLTVFRLRDSHRIAVLEMGASHKGEIAYLADIARPDIGVVTNAAAAHLEGFGSLSDVAATKGELYESLGESGTAIVNRDDSFYKFWRDLCGTSRVVSFGLHEQADYRADEICESESADGFELTFICRSPTEAFPVSLPMAGRHNVVNALAATAAALAAGVSVQSVQLGLGALANVSGRLKPLAGPAGIVIYDDSYNANPASVTAAISFLAERSGQVWLVLGDMGELGADSESLHADVGKIARAACIDRLFCVGSHSRATSKAFGEGALWFESTQALIAQLQSDLCAGSLSELSILVKGSRFMRLETVVDAIAGLADQKPAGEQGGCRQ